MTDCPDCKAATARMKAQGFRNPYGWSCYEHAAVNWDERCAANADRRADAEEAAGQPDLFEGAQS